MVKNDVVKQTEYNKLVTKVDNIDTTNFVKKNKYEKDGSDFEDKFNKIDKKIPDVSSLVKKIDFNAKISEAEGKIPSITGLATNSELTAVENKIPDVIRLVKKTNFNAKITELEDKTHSISGLATNSALIASENKIPDVSSLVKNTDYNTKISNIEKKITDHDHDKYITTPGFGTMAADVFNATLAAQTDLIKKTEFDFELKGY